MFTDIAGYTALIRGNAQHAFKLLNKTGYFKSHHQTIQWPLHKSNQAMDFLASFNTVSDAGNNYSQDCYIYEHVTGTFYLIKHHL